MTYQPLVSIIIPTYQSSKFLEACLISLKKQSYPNFEIIVVDNFSKDSTLKIALNYTDKVYTKGPERSAQRNYGASQALGEYLLFIDSDMVVSPNVVSACVEKILINKETKAVIIPEESFGIGFWAKCKKLEKSFYVGVPWMEAARFFNKAVFLAVGGYNEDMTSAEDWDLSQRVGQNQKIDRIENFIYHNEGNIRLTDLIRKKFYYAKKIKAFLTKSKNIESSQISVLQRYKLFFSNPARLLSNPIVGIGMLFMKLCEFAFGAVGYLISNKTNENS